MAHVFAERLLDASFGIDEAAHARTRLPGTCSLLHRVAWQESIVSTDGRRIICRFDAPDTEAVRIVLRNAGVDVDALWPGSVAEGANTLLANHVVEQHLDGPLDADPPWVRNPLNERLRLVRMLRSSDHRRLLSLIDATDASALELASQWSPRPVQIWPCRHIIARAIEPGTCRKGHL